MPFFFKNNIDILLISYTTQQFTIILFLCRKKTQIRFITIIKKQYLLLFHSSLMQKMTFI